MRLPTSILTIAIFFGQSIYAQTNKFDIILKDKMIPGKINKPIIDKLSEPLKAIAAYYSALGGSNCNSSKCELTTALGLGKQGSDDHIKILKKWFKTDKSSQQLIKQNCYQPPNTASIFSDYQYLSIEHNGSKVTVRYSLFLYNHGKENFIVSENDSYTIEKDKIIVNHRKI